MSRILKIIFIIAVVIAGYIYRDTIKNNWMQVYSQYFPCKKPITYSIVTFDTKFGISKQYFLEAIKDAEAIWEKPIGRELFKYETDGSLKINLIYDSRQETTNRLKSMGIVVHNNNDSYDALKQKYNEISNLYNNEKSLFESRVGIFEARKKVYEAEVLSANRKGRVSQETIDRLDAEKEYLNTEITALNKMQNELNDLVSSVNALASALNQLAKTLNLNVTQYNTIGGSLGREFEEATYVRDTAGQRIDIYQFNDRAKLVRVLAHELGHALGLDHIEDANAIMYRLNNGINEKLTAADLVELKNLCGVK